MSIKIGMKFEFEGKTWTVLRSMGDPSLGVYVCKSGKTERWFYTDEILN